MHNKEVQQKTKQILKDYEKYPWKNTVSAGGQFEYVNLSYNLGFKFTRDLRNRDITYNRQRHAAEFKLAPPVQQRLSFTHAGKKYYGYVTARAKLPDDIIPYTQVEVLKNELFAIGVTHTDLNICNIGYYGGRLVCIDFDDESCYFDWDRA